MPQYDEDAKSLDTQKARMAKFCKVAFHCHSPLSSDWGKRPGIDKTINDRETLLKDGGESTFLAEVIRRCGCDMLVITDHMKCGFAERLALRRTEMRTLSLLPGMEVNFATNPSLGNVRLHILVVLPEGSGKETFMHVLPQIPPEDKRNGSEVIKDMDLREWVETIHKYKGIAIAAHVESTNGIRSAFRQSARSVMELLSMEDEERKEQAGVVDGALKDLIFDAGFDAVEIRKPEDRHHYRWCEQDGRKRRITTVLGLDAHCFEDYGRTKQLTLMKMTNRGMKDLRDALKFPETRIRFSCDLKEPPSPRLVGLSIHGNGESFFEKICCGFSENLNCIVGPRGSGKSTLIEALRYLFGYNRSLGELDYANRLSDRIKSLQKHNLTGSLIRAYYRRKDGAMRILEATFDQKQDYTTRVFDEDGKGVPVEDVEKCGDYPLRLYGWSEIETLGRDQARQRLLLDRMVPNLQDALEARTARHEELSRNREKIETNVNELNRYLDKDGRDIFRFEEYKRDFDQLNEESVKECFEAIDLVESKLKIYKQVKENCRRLINSFAGIDANDLAKGIDALVAKGGAEIEKWWQAEELRNKQVILGQQFLAEEIGRIKERLTQLMKAADEKVAGLTDHLEAEYARLRKVLSGEPDKQRVADLRRNAKTRLDRISEIRDSYLKTWQKLRELINERCRIAQELLREQNAVTGVRATAVNAVQEKLNKFMGNHLQVTVQMSPGRDRSEFKKALGNYLRQSGKRINKRLHAVIPDRFTPPEFGNLALQRRWDELKGKYQIAGETVEISDSDVQLLKEIRDWYEHNDSAAVDILPDAGKRLTDLLSLQESDWDDGEAILLNDVPVDKLSPGQRSSAMLPLIALAEDAPLIIDQPEDNLDNRLVGHVLVDILAELKEQRQIIVCTHNPNIVVSGDAEQVIVLQAESNRKGKLEAAGSIDNDDIVDTVIDLMEGGREAFIARRERYGI